MPGRNGGDMRRGLKRLAGLTAIACIGLAPASVAGTWKHQVIPNDGDVLTYSDDGKVTFYIGCGRGFALHVKYPGAAKKEGETDIAISTAKGRMTFNGEFEEPFDAKDPVPMNFATDFRQTHFGYQHSDPQVFGKKWNATKVRLLNMLDSNGPITISAEKSSYQLPAIDAGEWHKGLETCKN
jgi:hypothetical protein